MKIVLPIGDSTKKYFYKAYPILLLKIKAFKKTSKQTERYFPILFAAHIALLSLMIPQIVISVSLHRYELISLTLWK